MTDANKHSRSRSTPAKNGRNRVATIYDVARLAQVNPSTVSRALNNPGRINATTEQRVQEAAKLLRYQVNPVARALPTGRTRTIGLVVADVTNPMFFGIMRGAEQAASDAGYTLVLAESQESGARESGAIHRVAPIVDGLILVTTRLRDAEIRENAEFKPLVVMNREVDSVCSIVPDIASGIDEALNHLSSLGHRSITYLAGPARSWMSSARWHQIKSAARRLGLHVFEIGHTPPTIEGGKEALERVLASGVTAVMAYNDLMAIGLMRAAQSEAIAIPEALSIVGFDNIFGSDFTSPPLSTISAQLEQLGMLATHAALDLIDDWHTKRHGQDEAKVDTALARPVTTFLLRGSVGHAKVTGKTTAL